MTEQFDLSEKLYRAVYPPELMPTKRSKYHSEIHGSEDKIILSPSQCKYLAKNARVCIQ